MNRNETRSAESCQREYKGLGLGFQVNYIVRQVLGNNMWVVLCREETHDGNARNASGA